MLYSDGKTHSNGVRIIMKKDIAVVYRLTPGFYGLGPSPFKIDFEHEEQRWQTYY